jgi:hypothetical protein
MHQKENPQKPPTKVFKTKEETHIALENRKKIIIDSPRSVLKKKNKAEEGGTSSLGMKREQENIHVRAQKMMRGIVEPSTMPTIVQVVRQTIEIPHMTSPHERVHGTKARSTTNDISTRETT